MLQFLNPLMLWGLAAASVPVVIHLLNRRRFQRQRWAAMEWLLLAARENQRRFQIENLLLLLLRTAAILLLALALARPVLSQTALALGATRRTHLFLVIDNSGSTAARSGLRSTLEDATATATELLSELGTDDPVTLVLTNDNVTADRATGRPRVILRESRDHDKVRRVLSELSPAPVRADLADTLTALDEVVPDVDGREKKVAIITDLQRTSLDRPETGDSAAAPSDALREGLQRLHDKGCELLFVPAGRAIENVGIISLRPEEDRDVVQGASVAFLAEVANFSERPQRVEIRFLVDGKDQGDAGAWIDLPGRSAGPGSAPSRTQRFAPRFEDTDTGAHVVEAHITADAFPLDDARTYSFRVRPRLRVLAVDGDPAPLDHTQRPETFYLAGALAWEDDGPIDVRRVDVAEYLSQRSLADWDMIVLANVERPAPDEATRERLEGYLRQGGAVLLTVGDHTLPDVWNDELWRGGEGPLPVRLIRSDVRDDDWLQFDLGENRHPILRDITAAENSVFFQSPFLHGHMVVDEPDPALGADAVLRYTDLQKSPALVERRFGRGRVLLLTTTVDTLWGGLPGSYVFPALLHETVYVLTSKGNDASNLTAFQPYQKTFPANFESFEVAAPDGSPAAAQVETPPDAPSFVTVTGTAQLGAYSTTLSFKPPDILVPPPPPEVGVFTVTLSPFESDLRRVDPAEITMRYVGVAEVSDGMAVSSDALNAGSTELHRGLLIGALLCLLAEVALARRIGLRRSRA